MQVKSAYEKIKTTPGVTKTRTKIRSTTNKVTAKARDEVQHSAVANLQGKGASAKVLTTHTLTHEKFQNRRKSYGVVSGTYGQGKGKVSLSFKHKGYNTPRSTTHTANINVRHVAVGAAVAYGGYKAYQHRDQIKQKASQMGTNVHNAFHSTHQAFGHKP